MALVTKLDERESIPKITAVIVLYRMSAGQSQAFLSLMAARSSLDQRQGRVDVILWDNSPSTEPPSLPEDVLYFHDPKNAGLAGAYNKALEVAVRNESQWLITLDQDSTVPGDYLLRMASNARLCETRGDIGAIVPQIAAGMKRLSPNSFVLGALPRWFPPGFRGVSEEAVFAFNSGAMIRIKALLQVGGYDLRFPIDYCDAAMFYQLHRHGKRIYIDGGIRIAHEFSMTDMNQRMNTDRYRIALLMESAFWDLYMNWLAGCERTGRLILRMAKHWTRKDRSDLREITREFIALRLLHGRKRRIEKWKAYLAERAGRTEEIAGRRHARISVCMAAYNGGRYIEEQLGSILPQLRADDEIVIVDDCSGDDTIARIKKINDRRIRLFAHEKNEGVASTFEDALRAANGDLLFLCDDDDVWAPNKVERILSAFREHPDAQIVISRAELIDEHGTPQADNRMNRFGKFTSGFWRNIFKNHYQGSAMAIRASLLGSVLPLPRKKLFLHDAWIGTRNELAGGRTVFIDETLFYYRRHSQNANQVHPWTRKFKLRLELIVAHIVRAIRGAGARPATGQAVMSKRAVEGAVHGESHSWSETTST